jgi:hypothetical protein
MSEFLAGKVRRVHEIESLLGSISEGKSRDVLLQELWGLYRWTFNVYKMKGIVEAKCGTHMTPAKVVEAMHQSTTVP